MQRPECAFRSRRICHCPALLRSRVFEIVPLETVSETSSNASMGDLNGDGNPDIVLVQGRHWQLTTKIFMGDGKGHFVPGSPLPSNAAKSYSGSLADVTKSGHLDIVLSNDAADPKLILVNDRTGHFKIGGTYGDPKWPTRNAVVGDLNSDGYPDIAVAIVLSRPMFASMTESCILSATHSAIHRARRAS